MYRINPLPRKVLITTDEVIALGPVDQDANPRNLLTAIAIAEDRFIKQGIGKELYNDFREKKNVVVTAGNITTLQSKFKPGVTLNEGEMVNAIELVDNAKYVELWNEYLWSMVAECVVYIASPTNYSRHTSQGEMNNNPQVVAMQQAGNGKGAASVGLKEMQWKLDQLLMNRIDPIKAAMHEWLCDNKADFPLYKKDCGCGTNGISTARKTGWIDVYSNDKNEDECC